MSKLMTPPGMDPFNLAGQAASNAKASLGLMGNMCSVLSGMPSSSFKGAGKGGNAAAQAACVGANVHNQAGGHPQHL